MLMRISMMTGSVSLETLLEAGFQPRRSIVFAFGIDEESAGSQVSLTI